MNKGGLIVKAKDFEEIEHKILPHRICAKQEGYYAKGCHRSINGVLKNRECVKCEYNPYRNKIVVKRKDLKELIEIGYYGDDHPGVVKFLERIKEAYGID